MKYKPYRRKLPHPLPPKKWEKVPPNMDDPFKPDLTSDKRMTCAHCRKSFPEKKVIWGYRYGSWLWWCPIAGCNGAGVGFEIREATDAQYTVDERIKWKL